MSSSYSTVSVVQQGMKTEQCWSSFAAVLVAVENGTRGFIEACQWASSLGCGVQDQGSWFCVSGSPAALLGLRETLSDLSLAEEFCRTQPCIMRTVRLIGTPKLAVPAAVNVSEPLLDYSASSLSSNIVLCIVLVVFCLGKSLCAHTFTNHMP